MSGTAMIGLMYFLWANYYLGISKIPGMFLNIGYPCANAAWLGCLVDVAV